MGAEERVRKIYGYPAEPLKEMTTTYLRLSNTHTYEKKNDGVIVIDDWREELKLSNVVYTYSILMSV